MNAVSGEICALVKNKIGKQNKDLTKTKPPHKGARTRYGPSARLDAFWMLSQNGYGL